MKIALQVVGSGESVGWSLRRPPAIFPKIGFDTNVIIVGPLPTWRRLPREHLLKKFYNILFRFADNATSQRTARAYVCRPKPALAPGQSNSTMSPHKYTRSIPDKF